MCARYVVTNQMLKEAEDRLAPRPGKDDSAFIIDQDGDIRPADIAPAFLAEHDTILPDHLRWGLENPVRKGLLINARAESVEEKRTFAESFRTRRCLLPAAAFYEWDAHRDKVTFTLPAHPVLWLAGIYDLRAGERRFVILTREANASMQPVHDRMPLLIDEAHLEDWLLDVNAARHLALEPLPALAASRDYEQLSLF